MIQDVQGIHNVFNGTYTTVNGAKWTGTGIKDAVSEVDSTLATTLGTQIDSALSSANALEGDEPFENLIKPNAAGNAKVTDLIAKLRTVESTLETVFTKMKFSVPAPE